MEVESLFPQDAQIDLPVLEAGPFRQKIGLIYHAIRNAERVQVISIGEVIVSPRITEKAFTLSNGQTIIITSRKKFDRPAGIDGILIVNENGLLQWRSHKLTDEFRSRVPTEGLAVLSRELSETWEGNFNYRTERKDDEGNIISLGLRPPQIGGLHSIGGHWSLSNQAATIVMPTGTGKTETMLATLVAYNPGKILVVVPSQVLRDQTLKKFCTLGLLRLLGNVSLSAANPIVGVIFNRPRTAHDLEIIDKCNVIISTMSAIGDKSTAHLTSEIAQRVGTLIVDEAHHVGAPGWSAFKEHFSNKRILQFTATPYRRDGKLVDGKVIYEYALHQAQKDGYFKNIKFESVYEIAQEAADIAIANTALAQLRRDLASGCDHLMMARCADINRAKAVYEIYRKAAPEFQPVLIHSDEGGSTASLARVYSRESRIIICVNMLGEGFDLPQLKVAAVHDIHKSLAILLQFTGRFTRTSGSSIGDATVIANIARAEVSEALERLYSEDADWNQLLSEFSSQAAKTHAELISFLNESKRLDEQFDSEDTTEISHHLLRPTFNTAVFECEQFEPKKFHEGLPNNLSVQRVWLHEESHTIYFVARLDSVLKWTSAKTIKDRQWHLFVIHHDPDNNLLFLSSTDKSSTHDKIVSAVGGTKILNGETIFRCLGRITRLIFQNIGVKKHGRRNLRFAMYVGADVVTALSLTERGGSSKSNLSGIGWEKGSPITIGCSAKGRIWARDPGSIPELIKWCEGVGKKLIDTSIDPSKIISNVLIPEEIRTFPQERILAIEWPLELLRKSEDKVAFYDSREEIPLSMVDISVAEEPESDRSIKLFINTTEYQPWATYELILGGPDGYEIKHHSGADLGIKLGRIDTQLSAFFTDYPPLIRFMNLSDLDGNLLIKPQNPQQLIFPVERFEVWDWTNVDITKESIWKHGIERRDSIQWRTAQTFISGNYDVVFDDDAAGEAADLVCLREENDFIRLSLVHCKFTKGSDPGERVTDVVEVSSQAVRSTKWKWKFKDLCLHITTRERRLTTAQRSSRFLKGQLSDINRLLSLSRFKEIKMEIIIVQPGLSQQNITPDQTSVLAAAHSYLKETVGIDLDVICSA